MLVKTRVIPVSGIMARLIPSYLAGADPTEEVPTPFGFEFPLSTFTAGAAKRNSAGPFAAGVLAQGNWAGDLGYLDILAVGTPTKVADRFYNLVDLSQGTIVCWFTPEWNGNDGKYHYIYRVTTGSTTGIFILKTTGNVLQVGVGGQVASVNVAGTIVAGTTYCIVGRWNFNNTLDGTNYACISINDAHTFGMTTKPTDSVTVSSVSLGSSGVNYSSDGLSKGLTVYRRCLYDGTYGHNVGNGDEINLIYAAGAGADPCTITGSWDVTLCVCTDSQVGALVTG